MARDSAFVSRVKDYIRAHPAASNVQVARMFSVRPETARQIRRDMNLFSPESSYAQTNESTRSCTDAKAS